MEEWDQEPFDPPAGGQPPARRQWPGRHAAGVLLLAMLAVAAGAYSQKSRYSDDAAELSRSIIGDENTARIEFWYFRLEDGIDRTKYRIFGGEADPFARGGVEVSLISPVSRPPIVYRPMADRPGLSPEQVRGALDGVAWLTPQPLALPEVRQLLDSREEGEGVWTTAGLPRSSSTNMLMAKTFVRPDASRPTRRSASSCSTRGACGFISPAERTIPVATAVSMAPA